MQWKCRSHSWPLKRRPHHQSHCEWHLQMIMWHLDPDHSKNESDSIIIHPPPNFFPVEHTKRAHIIYCWFWLFYQFTQVTVALPGEIVGALQSLLILARLTQYLTFSLTWSPAVFQLRVVFWQHRLSAGALEWHFTLSPLWTHAPTVSSACYISFLVPGSTLIWNTRLLACFFPTAILIIV